MFSLIAAPENFLFSLALALMFGIAILEGISTLFGAALSNVIDSLLPELPDTPGPGIDLDADVDLPNPEAPYALSRFFSWLRVGQVPVLMLLVVFLTAFGLIGLGLQSLAMSSIGRLLPGGWVVIPVVFMSLPVVRWTGGVLARTLPSDETEAVSITSLIGRVATVTIGVATYDKPAEARVKDRYGTTHLLMVKPDLKQDSFSAGEDVLLVRRDGAVFNVIKNPNPKLVD